MALGNGIPALVCRFAEQTTKGFMWQYIKLGDCLFDLDKLEKLYRVASTALAVAQDFVAAKVNAVLIQAFVHKRQHETSAILRKAATKSA